MIKEQVLLVINWLYQHDRLEEYKPSQSNSDTAMSLLSLSSKIANEIQSQTPAPATTPFKCPICDGRGIVPGGFYTSLEIGSTSSNISEPCRQCGGSGIVYSNTPKVGEWIDVKVKPQNGQYVLVLAKGGRRITGIFNPEYRTREGYYAYNPFNEDLEIIEYPEYWMPLPEPPTEKGE